MRLRHGPIDVLVTADGPPSEVALAMAQARAAFPGILPALCRELPCLKASLPSLPPRKEIAAKMHAAVSPFGDRFITPMAAVAGAVADSLLASLTENRTLRTATVNNGGDIAFHLTLNTSLRCGLVADIAAPALDGTFTLHAHQPTRGIATSGRACKGQGGRSFSFGIADAVTILAATAAQADAAATVVANAVDLPGHPAIIRRPATDIDPESDLGSRRITWDLGCLDVHEIQAALDAGARVAHSLIAAKLIHGAILALRGEIRVCGITIPVLEHA